MITVIVTTKNREESLRRCIKSLQKNDLKGVEIIVVYSGRFNNTEKIVHAYKCDKKSLVFARDLGWRKAKGEIVVYIDDDVEVTKDWLKAIKDSFKDISVAGSSGPTIVSKEEMKNRDVFRMNKGIVGWFYKKIILEGREKEVGKLCSSGMWTPGSNYENSKDTYVIAREQQRPWQSRAGLLRSARNNKVPISVDYLEACNMALRRSLIEKVGGFDLGFKGTSEWCEVDLAMRIKKLGYRLVFNPKAKVYHHVSCDGVFKARDNYKERMDNFLRYYFKHFKINWRFLMCVVFLNGYWVYKKIWKNI